MDDQRELTGKAACSFCNVGKNIASALSTVTTSASSAAKAVDVVLGTSMQIQH